MREMSPTQFFEEYGGSSISRVTRNVERLAEHGWLRHVRSEGPGGERRGGVERFYRATELAFCDQETWAQLPYSVQAAFSWNAFKEIAARLRGAIEVGAFDPSRNLTSMTLLVDQQGWERGGAPGGDREVLPGDGAGHLRPARRPLGRRA